MGLRNRAVLVSLLSLTILLLVFSPGCRKARPGFERNLPPETFLSSVPMDSSFVFYRVKLFWGGMDPDGQVMGYYYAVMDSNLLPAESSWVFTTDTEKEFSLLANNPEMLGHRFFAKAVDDKGLQDPTPASIFFYARDYNLPKITFSRSHAITPQSETILLSASTIAQLVDSIPGDTIPTYSVCEFSWRGSDADPGGRVTGFIYRSSEDAEYKGGTLADTSYSFQVRKAGLLNFEVLGIDDAGALSRRDSLRYFVVNNDPDTWIVPPCDTCCAGVKGKGFIRDGSIPGCEGDTLRFLGNVTVSFAWGGWDKDGTVIGWTHRMTRDGGGPAYEVTSGQTWEEPLPKSGNYQFLVRARDNEGKEDGTPASVRFYLNCAPFFFGEKRGCSAPGGVLETCNNPCNASLVDLGGGFYEVSISCSACDFETSPTLINYRVDVNGNEGTWREASEAGLLEATITQDDGLKMTSGSVNTISIWARDRNPDNTFGRISGNSYDFTITIP